MLSLFIYYENLHFKIYTMKTIYSLLILLALTLGTNVNAQSISASKIFKYLDSQDITEISKDLKTLQFVSLGTGTQYNSTMYSYKKTGNYGVEEFSIVSNAELFSVLYKPVKSFYLSMKEKMLTSDFIYSYSHNSTKYYESSSTRIGVNDVSGIISFFVELK